MLVLPSVLPGAGGVRHHHWHHCEFADHFRFVRAIVVVVVVVVVVVTAACLLRINVSMHIHVQMAGFNANVDPLGIYASDNGCTDCAILQIRQKCSEYDAPIHHVARALFGRTDANRLFVCTWL
jgi:hypothetical protein